MFERVENFRQSFRLDPEPGISDFNTQLSLGIVAGGDDNLPVPRSELHRVIDQVPKDLLQARGVCSHMHLLCAEAEGARQILAIDFRLTNVESVLQQCMRINDFKI